MSGTYPADRLGASSVEATSIAGAFPIRASVVAAIRTSASSPALVRSRVLLGPGGPPRAPGAPGALRPLAPSGVSSGAPLPARPHGRRARRVSALTGDGHG